MARKLLNRIFRVRKKYDFGGVLLLPGLIDKSQIDEILEEFSNSKNKCIKYESDIRLFRQAALSKTEGILRKIVRNNFKKYLYLGSVYTHKWMVNEIVNCNTGSGGGWHRDTSGINQFKIIIYLNNCDLNKGPFQYLNTKNVDFTGINNLKTKTRLTDADIELLKNAGALVETITGKAGDAFIVNTQHIHRGMPPAESGRLAVTSYSYPFGLIPENISRLL